jgi:type II secretory pathway pseudopilin PulG
MNDDQVLTHRRNIRLRNILVFLLIMFAIISSAAAGYALYQKNRADEEHKKNNARRLAAEAFLEISLDNMKSIRIAEAAYRMGLPVPPARTCQALSEAGYSSFKDPFYTVFLHSKQVNSAVFSPGGTRILTASWDGTAKVWYTPEAIYEWLKTAPIPQLTEEEKKDLGIN